MNEEGEKGIRPTLVVPERLALPSKYHHDAEIMNLQVNDITISAHMRRNTALIDCDSRAILMSGTKKSFCHEVWMMSMKLGPTRAPE